MKDILNRRIKHREMFRPFAPSILEEATGEFFEQIASSPFMTFAYPVRPEKRAADSRAHARGRHRAPANREPQANPLYWKLMREVGDLTGVPVVLNTSFNDNEPIVCRPEEALDCFLRTQMDVLVMGNFLISGSRKNRRAICRAWYEARSATRRTRRAVPARAKLNRRPHAHSAVQRIFSAGHFRHGEDGCAGGRNAGEAPPGHGARRASSYDPDEYYPFAFLRRDVRNNVTVERVGSTAFPRHQNAAPRFELS